MARSSLVKIVLAAFLLLGVATGTVFVLSLLPSAGKEPPTKVVDLASIPIDSFVQFVWKDKPIVIFRPGQKTRDDLIRLNERASPSLSASSLPPAFVYMPISTFRGCLLHQITEGVFDGKSPDGWYDPCHFGVWDYSGRWVEGVIGDTKLPNLPVPDFRFIDGGKRVELYTSY